MPRDFSWLSKEKDAKKRASNERKAILINFHLNG